MIDQLYRSILELLYLSESRSCISKKNNCSVNLKEEILRVNKPRMFMRMERLREVKIRRINVRDG